MKIGLEVELIGHDRTLLRNMMRRCAKIEYGLQFHDDGSIRFPNYAINGVPFLATKVRGRAILPPGAEELPAFGPEIVSAPLSRELAIECAKDLAYILYKVPESVTASIHVHVSGFETWKHIHNLLLWFYYMEAPIYRVSALGKQHRGEQNDYKFCRPISQPIALQGQKNLQPLIDVEKLLTARNFSELLYAWGRMDWYWNEGIGHYCPHRLHGINIVSLTRHGTVEFRVFNGVYRFLPEALQIALALYDRAKVEAPSADISPMVLGSTPQYTMAEASEFFGFDVTPVWGKRWCKEPTSLLLSHYQSYNEALPSDIPMRSATWKDTEE